MIGGTKPPLHHQLDVAAAFVHALLDRGLPSAPVGVVEALRRRREALALLEVYILPCAVFEGDEQTPYLVNAAWRAVFAASAKPPRAMMTLVDQVLSSGVVYHAGEIELGMGDEPVYGTATFRPVRVGVGATTGVIVVCAVTTDEVIARRLGVSEATLIWGGPRGDAATYFNPAWHGFTAQVAPWTWLAALHEDDRARCNQALGEAARLRLSTDIEVRIRRGDAAYRWHRVVFQVDVDGWFGHATNIHEIRTANDERSELLAGALAARADAEQANRLKDQFLAAVSHELRAPMTTLLLWEKVLRDHELDPVLRGQALDAIHESAITQSRLVGDLLDIARGISGKLYIDARPLDVARTARDAVAAISTEAAAKGVAVEHRGAMIAVEVQADAVRIRQVLDNVLSNALKFTEPGGTIVLSIHNRARSTAISVSDTGRGIAREFLSQIFEPFSQTDDALTRKGGGLGLGLAISRQLVKLHHGTLTAASGGTGKGSVVTMTLPTNRRRRSATRPHPRRAIGLDRLHVLVIDDDRRVLDALALLLDRAGAVVATAESAATGRAQLEREVPAIIVCDIAMPGEDGYSFITGLRAQGLRVPAIALTAHAMGTDATRALAAGFDLHLAKPIDFERLASAISDLVVARAN